MDYEIATLDNQFFNGFQPMDESRGFSPHFGKYRRNYS